MFFYLSKIFWWLFDPGNLLFLLLLIGVVLLWVKQRKAGTVLCSLALVFYIMVGVLPVGGYMVSKLENRFPAITQPPNDIDGIIVLGGMIGVRMTEERGQLSLNDNVERLSELVHLTKRYPDVPVIFTGGAGLIGYPDLNEGVQVQSLLRELVQPTNDLKFETKARNTFENAVYTKEMLGAQAVTGRWLLVTSASHMPRAVGCFRHQGVDVVAYPVDYETLPSFSFGLSLYPRNGLGAFRQGVHEWLGLLVYAVTDKTSEFFPAP